MVKQFFIIKRAAAISQRRRVRVWPNFTANGPLGNAAAAGDVWKEGGVSLSLSSPQNKGKLKPSLKITITVTVY